MLGCINKGIASTDREVFVPLTVCQATHGILSLFLVSAVQKTGGQAGEGKEKSHEDDQRSEKLAVGGTAERSGLFCRQKRRPGEILSMFQYLKAGYKEDGDSRSPMEKTKGSSMEGKTCRGDLTAAADEENTELSDVHNVCKHTIALQIVREKTGQHIRLYVIPLNRSDCLNKVPLEMKSHLVPDSDANGEVSPGVSENHSKGSEKKIPEDEDSLHCANSIAKCVSLSIGDHFFGVVSHIQNPGTFFCQQLDSAQDNLWYRATVTAYASEDTVLVDYVDYGNSDSVPLTKLRPMIPALMDLPAQAIRCSLAGVRPPLGTWTSEGTSFMKKMVKDKVFTVKVVDKEGSTYVVELVDTSVTPAINISSLLIEEGCAAEDSRVALPAVTMSDVKQENEDTMNKRTCKWLKLTLKQTVSVRVCTVYSPGEFYCHISNTHVEDGNWYRAVVQNITKGGSVQVSFVDYGNVEEVPLDKIRKISPSFLKLPFQAIKCWLSGIKPCKNKWNQEATIRFHMCTSGLELQATVTSLSRDGAGVVLTDNSTHCPKVINDILTYENLAVKEVLQDKNNFPNKSVDQKVTSLGHWKSFKLAVGETITVFVTEIVSPDLFYAVPVLNEVQRREYKELTALGAYCKSCKKEPFRPKLGEACCAQFSGNGRWYRALVLEASQSAVKVLYADYGNTETLPLSKVLPITDSFLKLPFQTITCSLAGIEKVEWSPLMLNKLKEMVLKQYVAITVKGINGDVKLVTVEKRCENGGLNVADKLVNQGLVKSCSAEYSRSERQGSGGETKCCCTELKEQVITAADSLGKVQFLIFDNIKCFGKDRPEFHFLKRETHHSNLQVLTPAWGIMRFVNMSLLSLPSICIFLISQVLLVFSVLEIHVDQEMIGKISAAVKLMQCSASLDVLFLLDGSYSIGKGSFERSKHFAGKLCDALDIHPDRVRVGMIQFSSTPHLEFPLDSYLTKQEVKERIKRTLFRGGSTETGRALKYILRKGFPGGRNSSVPEVLIVVSDGKSQGSTVMPAMQVKERHITVFAVGIKFPRWEELQVLASEPPEQHLLFAGDADDAANGLYSALTGSVCSTTAPAAKLSPECAVDLLFLLDSSAGVTLEGFLRYKAFLKRFLQAVMGQDSPMNVGVAQYDDDSQDSVAEAPQYMEDQNLFLIGVGGSFMRAELTKVTGNPQQTVVYSDPQDLFNRIPELHRRICSVDNAEGCQARSLDLAFAVDASSGVGPENFLRLRHFVRSSCLHFSISRDVTQIALVVYGSRAHTAFALATHTSSSAILQAIDQVPFLGDSASAGSALLHIYSDVMTVQKGARPGVNKVVVLLTNGGGLEDAAAPAQQLRHSGILVFVVVVGDAQRDMLLGVAGSPSYLVHLSSYEDLQYYQGFIIERICEEAKSPVNLCKPNPCMNQGVCILGPGSYRCECHGWEGPHCESSKDQQTATTSSLLPSPSKHIPHRHLSLKLCGADVLSIM
ncbi:hypothetical protein BTVI_76600 [Pitangus sulphuratus]|nr:hypothetical protein BTVI_76600 [Pitangus sulphuratus]